MSALYNASIAFSRGVLHNIVITIIMPSTNYPQKAIREKNDTVLKYGIDEITDEFDKTRTQADKTALDAKDIIGLGTTNGFVKMASDMFRLVELDMVSVIM